MIKVRYTYMYNSRITYLMNYILLVFILSCIGLNSIYLKINCVLHRYMINVGIGSDKKIMNFIQSHLLSCIADVHVRCLNISGNLTHLK